MRKFLIFLIANLALISIIPNAFCAELNNKKFNDVYNESGTEMTLQGLGLKTVFLIKVLVAGLYMDKNWTGQDPLEDVSKRIEVAYFYPVPAGKLAKETRRRIILNTSEKEYAEIKSKVDQMDGYFVNLKPEDRYALTYIPGRGTLFTYNDRLVGEIPGEKFARALFAVWVGDQPISDELKNDIMGKK